MAIGLGLLRLAPRDFWAMSLPELQAAMAGLAGEISPRPKPPSRRELENLMACFPD
jgi:uncharacterized phage protein (TIGR02216 family)